MFSSCRSVCALVVPLSCSDTLSVRLVKLTPDTCPEVYRPKAMLEVLSTVVSTMVELLHMLVMSVACLWTTALPPLESNLPSRFEQGCPRTDVTFFEVAWCPAKLLSAAELASYSCRFMLFLAVTSYVMWLLRAPLLSCTRDSIAARRLPMPLNSPGRVSKACPAASAN